MGRVFQLTLIAGVGLLFILLSGRAEAAAWIGIPPWEIQRDISITQRLTLSNTQPTSGEMVSAEFTIHNRSQNSYTFSKIGVSARGPQCYNLGCGKVVDFPQNGWIQLNPGQSFTYKQQRTFSASGDYFAQLAYQAQNGNWYSLDSAVNFKVVGSGASGSDGSVNIAQPLSLQTTTRRVNDIYYAQFSMRNDSGRSISYRQIGVAVRGPNCGTSLSCGAIADFPYDKNITLAPGQTHTFRQWQQLTKAGSYFMQIAVLTSANRWEFIGNQTQFTVQPASNAQRSTPFRMSAHYHPVWNESDNERLALAKSIGIDLVRVAVEWRRLQPDGANGFDQWYGGALADFLNRANQQGVGVYLMVSGTPCWASADPHKNCQWNSYNRSYQPANPQHYANMMRELVRKHGHQVVAWEIWNEPNIGRFWAQPDPIAYTNLLKAASQAIKAQKGNAIVIGGAIAGTDFAFLQGMYSQGANHFYDALSLHPYTAGAPDDCSLYLSNFYCGIEGIRAMQLHNKDYRPIWLTEFGWSSFNGYGGVGEYNQQQYMQQALRRIKTWDFVAVASWYNLIDTNFDKGAPQFEHNMGLFRSNSQPKPAANWLRSNPH